MKKLLVIAVLFCFAGIRAQAQTSDTVLERTVKPAVTEAQFPGGVPAWRHYLSEHLNTAIATKNNAPKGNYVVKASFMVNRDGKVGEIRILEDPGYGTGEDFRKVLEKSPKWNPAIQDGKTVTYVQKQTVTYQVD